MRIGECVATMNWELLTRDGAAWMSYWDRHVRGSGAASGAASGRH